MFQCTKHYWLLRTMANPKWMADGYCISLLSFPEVVDQILWNQLAAFPFFTTDKCLWMFCSSAVDASIIQQNCLDLNLDRGHGSIPSPGPLSHGLWFLWRSHPRQLFHSSRGWVKHHFVAIWILCFIVAASKWALGEFWPGASLLIATLYDL